MRIWTMVILTKTLFFVVVAVYLFGFLAAEWVGGLDDQQQKRERRGRAGACVGVGWWGVVVVVVGL